MKFFTSSIFVLILECKELNHLSFGFCPEALYQILQGHKSKLPELYAETCFISLSASATASKYFSSFVSMSSFSY